MKVFVSAVCWFLYLRNSVMIFNFSLWSKLSENIENIKFSWLNYQRCWILGISANFSKVNNLMNSGDLRTFFLITPPVFVVKKSHCNCVKLKGEGGGESVTFKFDRIYERDVTGHKYGCPGGIIN